MKEFIKAIYQHVYIKWQERIEEYFWYGDTINKKIMNGEKNEM